MLRVTVQDSGIVAVLRCEGKIVLGEELSTLLNAIVFQIDKKFIVLDLTGVGQVDARGLGALVVLRQWLQSASVKLQVIPPKRVRMVLSLAGLRRYFETATARREASRAEFTIYGRQEGDIGNSASW